MCIATSQTDGLGENLTSDQFFISLLKSQNLPVIGNISQAQDLQQIQMNIKEYPALCEEDLNKFTFKLTNA